MTGYRKFMAWGSVNPAGGRVNRPGFLAPRRRASDELDE